MTVPGIQPRWSGQSPFAPYLTSVTVAGLVRRSIAFLIDGAILLVGSLAAYFVAGAFGAWTVDDAWLRAYSDNPDVWPATPALHVNLNMVFAASVAIAVLIVLYAAMCWHRFGALPGQRAMNLHVLDFDSGRRLSLGAALARSVAVFGALGAGLALYATLSFERLATLSISDTSTELLPPGTPLARWLDVISGVILLAGSWLLVVALTSMTNRQRRGAHDRIGGSIVIATRRWTAWQGQAFGAAPQPGWTPAGTWAAPGQASPIDWQSAPDPTETVGPAAIPTDQPPWKAGSVAGAKPLSAAKTAGIGRRVTAYLIDSTFVFLFFVSALTMLTPDGSLSSTTLTNERVAIFGGLAGGAIQLVYFVLGWSAWKATLGQRIVGISVVLEADGKAMSPMDALVRWAVVQGPFALVTIVPLAVSPVVTVGAACWAAFLLYSTRADANGQGIHDHFLKTKVVEG